MSDLLATLGRISGLLGKIGTSAVLREHLALAERELRLAKDKAAELEQEVFQLRQQVHATNQQLQALRPPDDFVNHRGALFRYEAPGRIEPVVYCPKCRTSVGAFPPDLNGIFVCEPCRWQASFLNGQLAAVIGGIPKRG